MRIIAGEFGGRAIAPPADRSTRPMLDRVREALFSTLGNLVEEATVLDLFSGTGSLGLEVLSRGATFVRFVERAKGPRTLLAKNIETFGVEDQSKVDGGDALSERSWGGPDDSGSPSQPWASLIFMDPPYPMWKQPEERATLLKAVEVLMVDILLPNGLLMIHTAPRDLDEHELPEGAWKRRYGRSILWYIEGKM